MNTEQLFQKLEEIEDSIADFDDCDGLLSTVFELRKTLKDYELVPVEPTESMIDAAKTAVNVGDAWTFKGVYKVMIAAAQESE